MPRTLLACGFATALLAPVAAPARQGAPAAPSTVADVMTTMTIPASDAIFDTASEPPETDEQWGAVRTAAATLAASGRLLMREELARDATTWMDMSRALVNAAEGALATAGARDRDGLQRASDDVYVTCENCHKRYLER